MKLPEFWRATWDGKADTVAFAPIEPDEIMLIDEHGGEGEYMDRVFAANNGGEVFTDRLKPGTYAIIKIGGGNE